MFARRGLWLDAEREADREGRSPPPLTLPPDAPVLLALAGKRRRELGAMFKA